MKTKLYILIALMLCVGVFAFPMTAYASTNDNRPTVAATVEGETLRITASGGFLGVEAVFINNERFNFRVDGVLTVDLLAFSGSEEIRVHAVDFAGNLSNVYTIANPHYAGLVTAPPESIPVTPSASNPFTPDGQASVLDNATNHDEKEFFTFQTPAGNVFFLVVDRQRGADNVYFLNAVTEQDLIALAEQSGQDITAGGSIPVSTTPQTPDDGEQYNGYDEAQEQEPPAAQNGGNGTMIFLIVAMVIAGGVGYYLKIVRPKKQGADPDYDDEDEDEEDLGDEMQFEDEHEVSEDERDEDYYNVDEDEPKVEDDGL